MATLAPAKTRNLPTRILRAFDSAKHLVGLSRSVKDTLAEICRFVDQNEPFQTVFAHKSKIADRIGASERTVYRHLVSLQEAKLIEVMPQERGSRSGRFAVARIKLTQKAAEMLGLVAAPEADIHSSPSDNLSSRHTLSDPTSSKSQPQRTENGLPVDLAWMRRNGLSRNGIFKLMGLAKAKAKVLSDIALATYKNIQGLQAGRLYSYLSKLIAGPTDFAMAAQEIRRAQQAEAEARVLAGKAQIFRERFGGTTLVDRAQTCLYRIEAGAKFAQVIGEGKRGTIPMMNLGDWIRGVESGHLVLATLETEKRLLGLYGR